MRWVQYQTWWALNIFFKKTITCPCGGQGKTDLLPQSLRSSGWKAHPVVYSEKVLLYTTFESSSRVFFSSLESAWVILSQRFRSRLTLFSKNDQASCTCSLSLMTGLTGCMIGVEEKENISHITAVLSKQFAVTKVLHININMSELNIWCKTSFSHSRMQRSQNTVFFSSNQLSVPWN